MQPHLARHSFYGWPSHGVAAPSNPVSVKPPSGVSNAMPLPLSSLKQRHSTIVPVNSLDTGVNAKAKSATVRTARAPSNNILFEMEYQQENFEYMHEMEKQTMPNIELMNVQPELHWFMRPYLVDFLIEIHQSFRLRPETLYLTMNLVDRYVSKRIVYKRHYQLVGCAALLIAAKFEDSKDRVPTVMELSQMCCNAYDPSAFTQMEGHVLSTLGWNLGHPTAESWLRHEYSCAPPSNPVTHSVARFLLEVTLFHERFIPILPSALAAGAMLLARHICRDPRPNSQSQGSMASGAASQIHQHMMENLNDLSMILIKKYSYSYYGEASTIATDWFRRRIEIKKAMASSKPLYRMEACSSDEDGDSVRSHDSGASVFSTPSRTMNRDDDDDDSMPVTPMSLHSVQDTSLNYQGTLPPRFPTSGNTVARPVTMNSDAKSSHTSWMSLAQLRPVARHPRSTSMEVDAPMSEKAI